MPDPAIWAEERYGNPGFGREYEPTIEILRRQAEDQCFSRPLIAASSRDSEQVVGALLRAGADPDATDLYGATPLHYATLLDHVGIVEQLLAARASEAPWVGSSLLPKPLMLAASTSPGAAQALLEAGASPSERALGRSALDVAAACDQDRLVARLLEHEAIGESDLESALRESAGAGSESVLSRLLSRHFGPFAGAALHRALRSAVKAQQLVATRRLLDAGAILDDPTSARPSPLIEAVRVGSSELIRMLLDAGANLEATLPNPEDYDPQERLATGSTPLIEAARAGDAEVAKVLLENGASVNAFDEGGVSALMAAMAVGAWDVASVLLDHGAGRAGAEPFEIAGAIACDDTERLRGILKKAAGAANSVVRDAFGRSWTPMSFAAAQRSLASAVFLLEVGSDPDSRIPTEPKHSRRVRAIVREGGVSGFLAMQREVGVPRYWTPLMISAWLGDREMVEVLLGANAQQLPIGPEHLTPLHLACAGDHPEVAEMLIRAGAELGCEACDGSTPLDLVPEGSRRVFAPSVGHSGAGHRRR